MEALCSLVERSRFGDLEAFGQIVRRFQDMAHGYAYTILSDFHWAEDAAQEAFVEAYLRLPDLNNPDAFPGWFRRIVFKHCDRITRRKRVETVSLDAAPEPVAPAAGPEEMVEERQIQERVLEAIRALPEHQRTVTTLFYINGYSQREIAAFLEVPVTTVKKRLNDSRKKLKRMIDMVDETLKRFSLPDDFADLVVRKAESEEDLKRAAQLIDWHARHKPECFASAQKAEKAGIYVVGEEGEVDGAGLFNETKLTIGSTVLRGVRPGEMGAESAGVPDPAFVRSFRACFKLAREKGISLAAAHGSQYDHAFCGFVPCFYYPVVRLPCERARSIVARATIREADGEQKNAAWQAWLHDPYLPKMSAFIGGGREHVIAQNGEIVGYALVNRHFVPAEHYDMPFGHISEVTVRTRDAALAVIKLASELAENVGDAEICLMQSHMTLIAQTMLSLGGTYLLRPSCDLVGLDAEMVAIVDLARLTEELRDEFQSRLNASPAHHVEGRFSIEMRGATVGFAATSGRVEIVAQKQKVHRVLPRWIVTRLYMGYYSGEDVLAMGPIPDDRSDGKNPDNPDLDMKPFRLPEAEAALFNALFPKLWPCSTPDPDVWPWVIGKEHPRYQHEEGKTPEMKARIDALRFPWIGY